MSINNFIPILGIPVINKPELIYRFIKSINFKINKLVIIDNSFYDCRIRDALIKIRDYMDSIFLKYDIINNNKNIGVAASWNYILRNYDCDFYCIGSSDIELGKNDLFSMNIMLGRNNDKPILVTSKGGHPTGFPFFALNKKLIEKIGYFDEDFYPGFYEDNEYLVRVKKNKCVEVRFDFKFFHGIIDGAKDTCSMKYNIFMNDKYYNIINNNREILLLKWGTENFRDGYTYNYNKTLENLDKINNFKNDNKKYLFSDKTMTFIIMVKNNEDVIGYYNIFCNLIKDQENIKFVYIDCDNSINSENEIFKQYNKFYLKLNDEIVKEVNNIIDDIMGGYFCIIRDFSDVIYNEFVINNIKDNVNIINTGNNYIINKSFIQYRRFNDDTLNINDIVKEN